MSDQPVQNYQNHVRYDKFIFAVMGTYFVAIILAAVGLFMSNMTVVAAGVIVASLGGVLGLVVARTYSVKVQDRVIRLEMRVRMRQVLPDEIAADIMDFSLSQLVGLRFASDDELPELARKVLDENITKAGDIKKLVRDWQADFLRV